MINHTGILQFMKNKVLIPSLIVGVLAAFFSFKYISHDNEEDNSPASAQRKSLIVSTVMKAIKEGHFEPRPVDDSLSYTIYHKLVDNLDYERKFYTQKEMDELKAEEFRIDDELNRGEFTFFDKLNRIFVAAIDRAD